MKKTISRFKKTAYCAKFRHDGSLLAAGGEECIVRVSQGLARFYQINQHKQYVWGPENHGNMSSMFLVFCFFFLDQQVFDLKSRAILRQLTGHAK